MEEVDGSNPSRSTTIFQALAALLTDVLRRMRERRRRRLAVKGREPEEYPPLETSMKLATGLGHLSKGCGAGGSSDFLWSHRTHDQTRKPERIPADNVKHLSLLSNGGIMRGSAFRRRRSE
jgi:hypothetical protein